MLLWCEVGLDGIWTGDGRARAMDEVKQVRVGWLGWYSWMS